MCSLTVECVQRKHMEGLKLAGIAGFRVGLASACLCVCVQNVLFSDQMCPHTTECVLLLCRICSLTMQNVFSYNAGFDVVLACECIYSMEPVCMRVCRGRAGGVGRPGKRGRGLGIRG